jgi:manganese transport protein
MAPAFVVVAMGVDGTETLIISQVVLSLILPVPMIALLLMTGTRAVMGTFTNRPVTQTIAWIVAALVLLLNVVLVAQTLGVPVPFLG